MPFAALLTQPTASVPTAPDYSRPFPFPDAAQHLRVSVKTLLRAAAANKIRTIAFGRRKLIPGGEVQRLAAEGLSTTSR